MHGFSSSREVSLVNASAGQLSTPTTLGIPSLVLTLAHVREHVAKALFFYLGD